MTPNSEPLNRRADAVRNRDAVVEAAIEVMAARPSASMKEIADASGLGRTTVYRHFPSREDLVRAIVEYVIHDSWAMLGRIAAPERPLPDMMRDLGVQAMALGARYRFLDSHRMIQDEVVLELGLEDNDPLVTYVTAARERGEARQDLPVRWMCAMVRGMVVAAIDEMFAGRADQEAAGVRLGISLVAVTSAVAR